MKLRFAAFLLLPISCGVFADDAATPYISVLGSYLRADYPGSDRNGYGATVLYGLPLTKSINLELNGFANDVGEKTPGADYIYGAGGDIQVLLSNGKIAPFFLGGIGADIDDVANTTRVAPYADVGAGLIAHLTPRLGLRAEARYYPVFSVDKGPGESRVISDARFNLGLQYSFGAVGAYKPFVSPPVTTPEASVSLTDSDGDGVNDPFDKCPNTPAGTPVDASGCPASLDSDGDGVLDAQDRCPDTPKGLKVDAIGCIIEQTVVLRSINFDFSSDDLTAEAKTTLDLLARSMILQKSLSIEIGGHTDALGPQSYNLQLSQKRAAAVKDYLVAHGVEASRLQSEGYGEFNPIADNNTESGRAENRRVEFKVLSKPAQ